MTGKPDAASIARAPRSRFRLPSPSLGLFDEEERELLMEHVRSLLSVPTAPYAEDAQVAVIRRFVADRAELELVEDEHANVIVTWPGSAAGGRNERASRTLAFSAHLDHPGFLYVGESGGVHRATFHGGVPRDCFPGAPVRFFACGTSEAVATARVRAVHEDEAHDLVAELEELEGSAHAGMFGMFDLTPGEMRESRLYARVCDDLMGAAAILSLLDLMHRRDHAESVVGIFTRAEETGFVGCQALLRAGVVDSKVAVIGLECSPRRPTAKVGAGPVIRVGDRESVFDPELTHRLQEAAARLRRSKPSFVFQRALMDGGSCESTAYNMWNVPAGGMCLALGNYHNVGKKRADGGRAIAAEFVDWHDFEGLVALMLECASHWTATTPSTRMRERMDFDLGARVRPARSISAAHARRLASIGASHGGASLMAETTWGDEGQAPPKKKSVPTWVWFCGGGCLLAVVVAVIAGGFLFSKAKGMLDPEQQWPKVAEILPFDERPPEMELKFGWGIGMGMYMLQDRRGYFHLLMQLPEEDADKTRKQMLDPSFSGGAFGVGGRKDPQRGTITVQGRDLDVLRFYQSEPGNDSGKESTPGAPKKPNGASIMIDLTPDGASRPLVLQTIRTNAKEPISDAEVVEILRPFHVGPNR